jgi:endonuclease III
MKLFTPAQLKKESQQQRATRTGTILERLSKRYPDAKIVLNYSNNWELLVSVMLSAQCTDKKVNEVTAHLFKKYRTLEDYVRAKPKEFEQAIRPTGFFRAKTARVLAAAKIVKEKFGGQVPRTMEEILTIPGVARKTGNVVLGNAYAVTEGIAVDTHVMRVSQRLGLTAHKDPNKIEQDLMALIPKKDWFKTTYLFIEHGRNICMAKAPRCDACPVNDLCPSAFRFPAFQKRK